MNADAVPEEIRRRTDEILARHAGLEGPLLPILHAIQAEFGFLPADVVPMIASHLNITGAEVHGVISFYHDFRTAPAGKTVVKICRAEACQATGADAVSEHAKKRLGVDWHGTTQDGRVTLEPVYCLGLCACGPAAMIDNSPRARVDVQALDALLDEACK